MRFPAVVAEPPPSFSPAAVAQPPLGGGSGATFTQWEASRSPNAEGTLLLGCVATPIPGWVEDMRPAIDARTVALMNGSAERVVGVPVEARDGASPASAGARSTPEPAGHFYLRPVGAPEDAPRIGIARTFVGWNEGSVSTCFAVCASSKQDGATSHRRRCDASVLGARLDGSLGPPPPGVVLGAVTWAVHHPAQTVAWGGVLAFALGVVAVTSRRRPRSRM